MTKLLNIITDNCGNISSLRIVMYAVIACVMYKYLHSGNITGEEVALVIGVLGAKAIQKQIEKGKECGEYEEDH